MADEALVLEVVSGARAGAKLAVPLPCEVGRAPDAGVALPDAHLSTHHGRVERVEGTVRYLDRGSSNGSVHVRAGVATPLDLDCPEAELWDQDELHLGDRAHPVVLRVHLREPDAGAVVARRPVEQVQALTDAIAAQPERLAVLYRHSSALARSPDLEHVLDVGARLVFDLLPRATHLAVALKERGGRYPVVATRVRGGGRAQIPMSRTLVRRVVEERAGLLLANAAAELAQVRSVVQAGLASTLAVPLWTGNEIHGVLQVDNRDAPGLFDPSDLELLTVAAAHIAVAAENARLVARLRNAEARLERENLYLKQKEQDETFPGLLGTSAAIREVLEGIEKVRETRVPVLILGETGTGKELVARALHYGCQRRDKLFVAQNCSALPENLLESELFGHVRGAFTGADRDKKGLFDLADGGTVFLDEIGEMPLLLQAKLLRVLQEGEIWPVGAPRPKRIDVRIVSATHRDLEKMVSDGTFRQDLYYRLHVYPLHMAPLRERREDVAVLARHFLARYAREIGRSVSGFAPEALDLLCAYDWPGNVRELQNEIQRALIGRVEGDLVLREDLSARLRGGTAGALDGDVQRGTLQEMLDSVERVLLARALRDSGQNKTRAAQALGITREGLHKKLTRFGMTG